MSDIEFDDFDDFGDNINFDDFDPEAKQVEDDRSPVSRVATSALEAFSDQATDTAFVTGVVKDALPKGYQSALGQADELTDQVQTIYRDSVKEITPALNEFREAASRHLPKIRRILPDSIGEKVESVLQARERTNEGPTQAQIQDGVIDNELGAIFGAQVQQQAQDREEQLLKDTIKEDNERSRHEAGMNQAQLQQSALNRLVSYQDNVASQFQRKMLELNFRQFFTQKDLLDVSKAGYTDMLSTLNAIAKNTALPDEAKVRLDETFFQTQQERLAGRAADFIGSRLRNVPARIADNVRDRARELTDGFNTALAGGTSMLDMMSMMDEMGELEPDRRTDDQKLQDQIGGLIGGGIASNLGTRAGRFLNRQLGRNDTVMDISNRLQFGVDNLAETLNEFGRGTGGDYNAMSGFIDSIRDLVGYEARDDGTVLQNLRQDATQSTPFDILTRRSIVEIIPGYLSRMLQQLEIMNTGDPLTDRTVYSADSESFVRASEAADMVTERIRSENDRVNLADRVRDTLERIGASEVLSTDAQRDFGFQILRDLSDGRGFFPERYADYTTFTDVDNDNSIQEIRNFITNRYGVDEEGNVGKGVEFSTRRLNDSRMVKDLMSFLPNIQESLNSYMATADKDQLREAGIITKGKDGIKDVVNSAFVWDTISRDLDNVVSGNPVIDPTQEPPLSPSEPSEPLDIDSTAEPQEIQETVTRFVEVINNQGADKESVQLLHNIWETLSAGNQLTTSLIARMDVWSNQQQRTEPSLTPEVSSSSPQTPYMPILEVMQNTLSQTPYMPLLEMMQTRNVQTDESITEIRDWLLQGNGFTVVNKYGGGEEEDGEGFFGEFGRKAADMAGKVGGAVKTGAGALGSYYKTLFNIGGSAVGKAAEIGSSAATSVKDFLFKTVDDIYVAGSEIPQLIGSKVKAGKYLDVATGKIIESWEDIKGEVRDIDTGEIVLSAEQFTRGLFNRDGESRIAKAYEWVKENPVSWLQKYYGALGQLPARLIEAGGQVKDFLEERMNRLGDVYVAGDFEVPRLRRVVLERGGYFDVDGNIIKSFKDIVGPVFNEEGHEVISQAEVDEGLFDDKGNKIELRSLGTLAMGAAGAAFRTGRDFITASYDKLFNVETGLFSTAGAKFSSLFGGLSDNLSDFFSRVKNYNTKEVFITSDLTHVYGPYTDGGDTPGGGGFVGPMPPSDDGPIIGRDRRDPTARPIRPTSAQEAFTATAAKMTESVESVKEVVAQKVPDSVKEMAKEVGDKVTQSVTDFKDVMDDKMPDDPIAYISESVDKLSMEQLKEFQATVEEQFPEHAAKIAAHIDERLPEGYTTEGIKDSITEGVSTGVEKVTTTTQDVLDQTRSMIEHNKGVFERLSAVDRMQEVAKSTQERMIAGLDKLNERLSDMKPRFDDTDGDGIREGSFMDLRRKEAEEEAQEQAQSVRPSGLGLAGGGLGALAGLLGGGVSRLRGLFGGNDDDEPGFFSDAASTAAGQFAGETVGDAFDRRSSDGPDTKKPGSGKKPTALSRLRNLGGTLLRGGGNLLTGTGSMIIRGGAMGAAALGSMGLTGGFSAGALTGATSAIGSGLSALGSGSIMGTLGSIAPAIFHLGKLAMGPVGWAALAGYGAYKLGSYIAGGLDAEPLEALRFSQYGIDPEDGDQLRAVRNLEDDMIDDITYDDNGQAYLEHIHPQELVEEYGDDFGVDRNSRESLETFAKWYATVFKPTLLTHATLARRADEDIDLDDIDDEMDDDVKMEFANKATELLASNQYIGQLSPFPDASPSRIDQAMSEIRQAFGSEEEERQDDISIDTTSATEVPQREEESQSPEAPTAMDRASIAAASTVAGTTAMSNVVPLRGNGDATAINAYRRFSRQSPLDQTTSKVVQLGATATLAGNMTSPVDMPAEVVETRMGGEVENRLMEADEAELARIEAKLDARYVQMQQDREQDAYEVEKIVDERRDMSRDRSVQIDTQRNILDQASAQELYQIQSVLMESLDTQRSMDDTLKNIEGMLTDMMDVQSDTQSSSNTPTTPSEPAVDINRAANVARGQTRRQRNASQGVVSMRKMA